MQVLDLPYLAELTALRRDLHAHPETAFHETRTAQVVAKELAAYGLEVHQGLAKTGVVGVLRRGSADRAIALRADMDALPLAEHNDFPHRSRHEGRMHACGHDGHTAMLLGAARWLAERGRFDGTLVFVFQPAEEEDNGAAVMIQDGLFERFPVSRVFGLHNWPGLPLGHMAVHDGPVMAGTCVFRITVEGHGAHAAMPQEGRDPVVAASQLVLALQTIVSRNLDPLEAGVVSVTQIHGGTTSNIIPDRVVLEGTLRSFKPEVQARLEEGLERLCNGVAASYGVQVRVSYDERIPATVNAPAETALCRRVARALCGAGAVAERPAPSLAAEDFAFMLQAKPGCYVWLGNGPGEGGCTLHNPRYDFNDQSLALGVSYWVALAEAALEPQA